MVQNAPINSILAYYLLFLFPNSPNKQYQQSKQLNKKQKIRDALKTKPQIELETNRSNIELKRKARKLKTESFPLQMGLNRNLTGNGEAEP